MAENEEELKSRLMKMKEESENTSLKLSIQKTKINSIWSHHFMANRWRNSGNSDRLFLGSKITADGDCSHEIKTLAPWKKSYDKPRQCIKKQRHYFANKGPSSQSYAL